VRGEVEHEEQVQHDRDGDADRQEVAATPEG